MKTENYHEQGAVPGFVEEKDVLGQSSGTNVLQKLKHGFGNRKPRMKTKPLKENELSHHRPYWNDLHHSWLFWVFVVLMFAGIIYYIMSVDFAFAPRKQMNPPAGTTKTQ